MIFTTNKSLKAWGRVLHDEDLAQAILDRVLERGRLLRLDGPSIRTLHVNLDDAMKEDSDQDADLVRISGTHSKTSHHPGPEDKASQQDRPSGEICKTSVPGSNPGGASNPKVSFRYHLRTARFPAHPPIREHSTPMSTLSFAKTVPDPWWSPSRCRTLTAA
jgi:IstB-like ATP binding protein